MVKIYARDGREEKFDSKTVEENLRAAGMPDRVAKEVAERVEDRVQDGWTMDKVKEQTDLELSRLEEDIERAHTSYRGTATMGKYDTAERHAERQQERMSEENASVRETKEVFKNVNP